MGRLTSRAFEMTRCVSHLGKPIPIDGTGKGRYDSYRLADLSLELDCVDAQSGFSLPFGFPLKPQKRGANSKKDEPPICHKKPIKQINEPQRNNTTPGLDVSLKAKVPNLTCGSTKTRGNLTRALLSMDPYSSDLTYT